MKTTGPKTYLDELSRRQFTLDWYKELGWKENPFKQQCLEPVEYFITGHEEARQKINFFAIQHQPFGTISAEKGCGATTMALWLRDELAKYKSRTGVVYLPLTGVGSVDFIHSLITSTLSIREKALVTGYYGSGAQSIQKRIAQKIHWAWLGKDSFYSSIASKRYTSLDAIRGFLAEKLKDRPLVIILDHIEHMHKQHAQILQSFFYAHLPIQVVAVGTKEALARSPLKLLQKKDALRIILPKPTLHETRDILAKRILFYGGETINPLNEAIIKKFYEKSDKNPRTVLALCQEHCVKAALQRMKEKHEQKEQAKRDAAAKKGHVGGVVKETLAQVSGKGPTPVAASTKSADTSSDDGAHPFSGKDFFEPSGPAPMDVEEPTKAPSFEIPADILKQIEAEEAQAKKDAKKAQKVETKKQTDDGPKEVEREGSSESAYNIKVKEAEGAEEISVVENIEEARAKKPKSKLKSGKKR